MAVKNLFTLGIGISPGSVAPLILLGLGVNPGSPSPATLLDVSHAWQLIVDGTDRYANLEASSLSWSEFEAGEIGTLRATLKETGAALDIVEWQEVVLKDGTTAVWGGYITGATPLADRMGNANRVTWEITAESYATILNRTRRVRKTYYGYDPGDILVDLFDLALDADSDPPNQSEFDTSTYVTTGTWPDAFTFVAGGEPLTDILDRLALLAGFVWWIDANKAVHFGAAAASTAPFGIKLAGAADYTTYFPPIANTISARVDATDIRNRVTVHGGTRVSAVFVDNFTGDGVTLLFTLTHAPVVEVVGVTVGGVLQSFGTDWYHSFDDYDCLVNYSHGTIRWDTGNAPPMGDAVVVKYRYGQQVTVVVSDATSIAQYGRVFDYEVVDRSITSEAAATAVGNAILAEFAYGLINGSLDVNRLGIHAGQRMEIVCSALSLSGYYQVRQINAQIRKGGLVTLTARFGGRRMRLSATLQGNTGGGAVTASGGLTDTPIAPGSGGGKSGTRDEFGGLKMTVADYGTASAEFSTMAAPVKNHHISFRNASDQGLHSISAWSDRTGAGDDREVLALLSQPTVDKFGYLVNRVVSQQEAWARLQAVGGYDLAGQQDASVNVFAYRQNGNWDHTRIGLDADTVSVQVYTGGAEPDPGTGSLPDGLLIYTDGTWNPGSGEGLYIRINAAWRPLAVAENARQIVDNSIDLYGNQLFNIGGLHLESGTKSANFNVADNPGVMVFAINTAGGNVTATLPALADVETGNVLVFVKVTGDGNQMIVDGDGSETINGATTISKTAQWGAIWVFKRNADWITLNY